MQPGQGHWDCSPCLWHRGVKELLSAESPGDGEASAASVTSALSNDRFIAQKAVKGQLFSLTKVHEKRLSGCAQSICH